MASPERRPPWNNRRDPRSSGRVSESLRAAPGGTIHWRVSTDDGTGYTDAKGESILDILDEARIWDAKGRPA